MRSSNASPLEILRRALLVALVSLSVAPRPLPAQAETASTRAPTSFEELLRSFRSMTGLEARFEEEKHVALLAAPLTSRGRIYFDPPSTLLRRVETPRPSEVLVTPTEVRLRRRGEEEVIDLRSREAIRPLVESMLWIFGGNEEALRDAYRVEYTLLSEGRWRLVLSPRDEPLSRLIDEVRVEGRGRAVERIEVRESSGDRSTTRILEADPHREFDADDRQRLFGTAER